MNYGLVSAVLFNKIALQRLHHLSKEIGVKICPIVGVGSAPFRGSLRPPTVDRVIKEYPSAYTFTIQSAFKYDYSPDEVREAVQKLEDRTVGHPHEVPEEKCLKVIDKYIQEYQEQVTKLAPMINRIATYVPSRRKRKLHIGLFGYSRSVAGITLPRVIAFTASLYSMGLPPEVLGLNALDKNEIKFIREVYVNFDKVLGDALRYLDWESPFLTKELKEWIKNHMELSEQDKEHQELTQYISRKVLENKPENFGEQVLSAAHLRKFLG
jgi:phosphoenolpyruvate carboxylase